LPRKSAGFVLPEAGRLYEKNPAALDRRLKNVLALAGFVDEKTANQIERGDIYKPRRSTLPEIPGGEVREKGLAAIRAEQDMRSDRRERMEAVFTAYMDGKGLPTIAREMLLSRSTVSDHLNWIEKKIGARVIRYEQRGLPEHVRGLIHATGIEGPRKVTASVRGWHSFRTTFITVALSAGIPMELVRRVTGHSTVDVVLKHYFRPGRAEFKREFEKAMPGLLMTGAKSRDDRLRGILVSMTPRTFKEDRARLIELLDGNS